MELSPQAGRWECFAFSLNQLKYLPVGDVHHTFKRGSSTWWSNILLEQPPARSAREGKSHKGSSSPRDSQSALRTFLIWKNLWTSQMSWDAKLRAVERREKTLKVPLINYTPLQNLLFFVWLPYKPHGLTCGVYITRTAAPEILQCFFWCAHLFEHIPLTTYLGLGFVN